MHYNKRAEREIKEIIPFTIETKIIKHLAKKSYLRKQRPVIKKL